MIRLKLKFIGRVQGVGFRYTAKHLANSLGLTGWVYNEWDGSVSMEVQGKESSINKLIEGLEDGIFISIDKIERQQIPLEAHESIFHIKDYY
ncbi:MAG: acylphosphatase [Treponema sp.]|nr:acylphosphatase [Treponema sp.]